MKTKEINIKWMDGEDERTYGPVVLKKTNYKEKCDFTSKILSVVIKTVNGIQKEEKVINTGNIPFWTVVYSIQSLPKYPNFSQLPEEKKIDIVSYLGCSEDEPENLGEEIFKEASQLNPLTNQTELKKK